MTNPSNFLDEIYIGKAEDISVDDDPSHPLIYAHNSLLGDTVEIRAAGPDGYCIYIQVNDGKGCGESRIPVRGRLPELIQALTVEYERVTGERI